MPTNLDKFRNLLEELFQLDQADLDFGIYRIMNTKRDEIVRFLNTDLLPQVKEAFSKYKSADKSVLQAELAKLEKSIRDAGMNPTDSPKVTDLKKQIDDSAVDVTALENEVFSHLTNFFRRYYNEGDFISQRRYKEGVYAIPYEGEEVKLHWANADQYYVKSSEYFKDYIFSMPSGKRVRVHLVAASTEQDNNKAAPGNERRFFLSDENPIYEEEGELFIRFEYRLSEGKEKQDVLNQAAIAQLLKTPGFDEWMRELSTIAPTEKKKDRTVLEKHLLQYTAQNTFDYFIHKDLGSFLRRELDFFIKNEVMHLDDIEQDSAPRVEQYLSQIKVIRSIAHRIITFLEQLENFQKKLWLKKKFVVETNYCITLDKVPEELYKEIAGNDAQREEWVRLFAIDEIKTDLLGGKGYSEPLTTEFLLQQPTLVVDTKFYEKSFKERLLSSISGLSETLNGTLIHSENFQAMQLLRPSYAGKLKVVYVDPPYNTGKDDFLYKDNYQHSSWLSFIIDRMTLCYDLLSANGALFCSIDDNEAQNLESVCNSVFGSDQLLAPLFIQVRYANKTLSEDNDFQRTIERVLFYAKDKYAFKPVKDVTDYPVEKFEWKITEKAKGTAFVVAGKQCWLFKPGEFQIEKVEPSHVGLKETWATGSLLRQKGSSGEFFGTNLAPRKAVDGLGCLYKVEGIGEDGLGYRYFTGPQKESATKGKFYSGIPLRTLEKIKAGDATKEVPIHNVFDFAGDFGNCRQEGRVDIRGGKKPEKLLERLIGFTSRENIEDIVFDPFCGSGTTPSVAHKLKKKYVAIEQGDYFDTKVLVRMKYTLNGSSGGIASDRTGMFKYIRLESYEDSLNNLELKRTDQQAEFLDTDPDLREQYILSYMLNVESRGGQSLLNIDGFRNPDNYKLKVERNGESQLVNVDLVETFNWLLGLTVKHIDVIRAVHVVEGTSPQGERVLVLWRNVDVLDNEKLDTWFEKQGYSTRDLEYDLVYINGDNNLENLRRTDQTWKVRLIEEEFQRLMFDVQDV